MINFFKKTPSPFFFLIFLLLIKCCFTVTLILFSGIGLEPDEAQYWTWCRVLDWGYYSKPPGIAWQILFSTSLFGHTELGVRFSAIIMSSFLVLALYYSSLKIGLSSKTSCWAASTFALSPMGIISSFLATTDGGLVLFWTLSSGAVAAAIKKRQAPNYWLLGGFIFLGALFKWPIYNFWAFLIPSLYFFPFLYHRSFFSGILISFCGLFPSFIWNLSNDWATFKHVGTTIVGGGTKSDAMMPLFHGNFWEFQAAQTALLSPFLYVLFFICLIQMVKKWKSTPIELRFCLLFSIIPAVLYSLFAIKQKMQGNWCVFTYPIGLIAVTWFFCEKIRWGKALLVAHMLFSFLLSLFIFTTPFIQSHALLPSYQIPYSINVFHHGLGWNTLTKKLKQAGYNPEKDFLFGDKYQMSSILSFYGEKQKLAYFFNIRRVRRNQFSYWPSMKEKEVGNTGYFVVAEDIKNFQKNKGKGKGKIQGKDLENAIQKEINSTVLEFQQTLSPYFKEVTLQGHYPIFSSYEKVEKIALIFKCSSYNGKELEKVESY